VKIGFKFQSLGTISNISAADPPVLLGQLQHWCAGNTASRGFLATARLSCLSSSGVNGGQS